MNSGQDKKIATDPLLGELTITELRTLALAGSGFSDEEVAILTARKVDKVRETRRAGLIKVCRAAAIHSPGEIYG